MGLSTTYTKVETDYKLQELQKLSLGGLKGNLKITDTAPTTQGLYILSDVGTYSNLGGLVTTTGKINYAYFDGTTWSKVEVAMPKGADGSSIIKDWAVGAGTEHVDGYSANESAVLGTGLYRVKPIIIGKTMTNPLNSTMWDALGEINQDITQNITNIIQEVDPSQIVPEEALYNDESETIAANVIKRIDKVTNIDVNYIKTTKWHDGSAIDDRKVDGVIYQKYGNDYRVKADFLSYKTVDISSYIPTDGEFHTISEVFPNVTLADVQSIEPTANLSNSAAWYIISKILTWLPKYGSINIDCDIQIDREIVIKRGFFKIISTGLFVDKINNYNPFLSRRVSIIQITEGQDGFKFIDGDGSSHLPGYIEDVWLNDFNLSGINYTGTGISFKNMTGTVIELKVNNVTITKFSYGIKKYGSHINNLFFNKVTTSSNYNLGIDLSSDSNAQNNYVILTDCIADSNGNDTVNGEIVPYTQVEGSYNLEKGGIRIAGTAVYIYNIALQLNNGLGINLPSYIFGGFISGYAEQNQIGDVGSLSTNPLSFRNCQILLYSLEARYYIPDEKVRFEIDPTFASKENLKNSIKSYSKNYIENGSLFNIHDGLDSFATRSIIGNYAELTLTGGYNQRYFKLNPSVEPINKNEWFCFSIDIFTDNINECDMALSLDEVNYTFKNYTDVNNAWTRISITAQRTRSGALIPFIRKFSGATILKVRNPILTKLTNYQNDIFDDMVKMPKQQDSVSTSVESLRDDFNELLLKLQNAKLMSNE